MPLTLEDISRRAHEALRDYEEGRTELVTPLYGVTTRVAEGALSEDLRKTTQSEIIRTAQAAEEDGLGIFGAGSPPKWAQYAIFDGGATERTCPLCRLLLGMVMRVGSSEYYTYAPPVHIGCIHYASYFEEKPEGVPDFMAPPAEVVKKHGHFVTQPHKYAPLRVPRAPGGPNFSPRRVRDSQTGEYTEKLRWVKAPEGPLSQEARTTLGQLAQQSQTIPAEAWEAARRGPVAELQRAGYVNITATLGEAQTMRVTKATVGEVDDFLRQSYAGAKVAGVKQVGTLEVAPGVTVPQWEVTYQEANARKVTLNKWGKLAAAVAAEGPGQSP